VSKIPNRRFEDDATVPALRGFARPSRNVSLSKVMRLTPILIVMFTDAAVSLRKVDRESLALSTNPQFLKIIDRARKEVRAGKTTSLETLERKFRVTAPKRKRERTRKTRRLS
jgi:hypothetical protein